MSPTTDPGDEPVPGAGNTPPADHESLRQALILLQDELKHARGALRSLHATELSEVNAKLVVAALRSDAIAEAALDNLAGLATDSYRDLLTGTPNRLLMNDHLEAAIALARRERRHFAVLLVDLDRFRRVVRRVGADAGNEVLRQCAQRLKAALRATDSLSRQGRDEFLALITQLGHPGDAARVARKMLHALAAPLDAGGETLALSASIGIAIYPEDGEDAATLVQHAGSAMRRSRETRTGGYRFHRDAAAAPRPAPPAGVPSAPVETGRDPPAVPPGEPLEPAASQPPQIRFLAMVAHELRHPLTPLKLAADMLACHDGRDRASMLRLQAIIDREVAHMSRLVGDLLDGTRIQAGKLGLQRRPLDMAALLRQSADTCMPAFQHRQQTLRVDIPNGPIPYHGDPVRLRQVFSNLLDNASKYTPEGGEIDLALTLHARALVVTVTDSGIGIAPDALETIFGLFVQDDRAGAYARDGIGIGLAVVRELVQAHGGTVVVHSEGANRGSRFVVTLPDVASPGEIAPD